MLTVDFITIITYSGQASQGARFFRVIPVNQDIARNESRREEL